jgi:hypothetical protein
MAENEKPTEKAKPSYVYFGNPEGDPRKKNRMFIECTSLRKEIPKVIAFVEAAIEKGALIIQIKAPGTSIKDGHAELYSDAGIDEKALKERRKAAKPWWKFGR